MPSVVQWKRAESGFNTTYYVVLDEAPTEGNVLLAFLYVAGSTTWTPSSLSGTGWVLDESGYGYDGTQYGGPGGQARLVAYSREVGAGESATITVVPNAASTGCVIVEVSDWSTRSSDSVANTTLLAGDSHGYSAVSSEASLLVGMWAMQRTSYAPADTITPDAGVTEEIDDYGGLFAPHVWLAHSSGDPGDTVSVYGSPVANPNLDKWGVFAVFYLFESSLVADFVGSPTSGARPMAVDFTNLTTGQVGTTQYEWDFGDGSTSTDENPTHMYSLPGTYTVTLVARTVTAPGDAARTSTETKTAYITVTEPVTPDPTTTATAGVWIDWGNDGFGVIGASSDHELARMMPEGVATITDDITLDVISVSGQDGGQYDTSTAQSPGQITIIVRNDDGKYTPRNTASPYHGLLVPGKKVWIGGTSGGYDYGIAAAFIKDIVPMPRIGQAQIICHDPIGKWQQTPVAVEFAQYRKAEDYRRLVLDALGLPSYRLLLDSEPDVLYVSGVRTNNGMSALEEINQAVGSRHWIQAANDKDDHFFYVTANRNRNLGNGTPAVSLTDDDISDLSGLRTTLDTVYNVQRMSARVGKFGALDEVWNLEDVPIPISPTATKTLYPEFGSWCTDLEYSSKQDGGTLDVIITNYGTTARVDITASIPTVLREFIIKGRPADDQNRSEAVARSQASIDGYGFEREGNSVYSDFLSGQTQAQGIAEANLFRTKDSLDRPVITIKNRFDKAFITRIGDLIEQTQVELFLDAVRFEVVGRRFSIDFAAKMWEFGFTLLETPIQTDIGFFILDSSALDGPDVLGF